MKYRKCDIFYLLSCLLCTLKNVLLITQLVCISPYLLKEKHFLNFILYTYSMSFIPIPPPLLQLSSESWTFATDICYLTLG